MSGVEDMIHAAETSLGLPEPNYIQDWYRQRNGPAFGGFAGAAISTDPAKALAASSMGHLNGVEPPFLIMHGTADALVSPVQSKQLFEALRAKGSKADYVLVKGAGHGDLTWFQQPVIDRVVTWFKAVLGGPIAKVGGEDEPRANL